jgi:hypothetical protein
MSIELLTLAKKELEQGRRCLDCAEWYAQGTTVPAGLCRLAAIELAKAGKHLNTAAEILLDEHNELSGEPKKLGEILQGVMADIQHRRNLHRVCGCDVSTEQPTAPQSALKSLRIGELPPDLTKLPPETESTVKAPSIEGLSEPAQSQKPLDDKEIWQ